MYDFANSAFITLVVTFIFSAYFARAIAPDPDRGAWLWAIAVNISAVTLALAAPFLGAIADASHAKKRLLFMFTVAMVLGSGGLAFAQRGDVVLALSLFIIANIGFEGANVFYNAFLPDVASRDEMGRVSGWGQACGYLGGLISLLIALGMVRGWDAADDWNVRSTNLLVAGWCAAFAIPLFLYVRQRNVAAAPAAPMGAAVARLRETLREVRQHRDAAWLILARTLYNDGLSTVFAFASIFAASTFGMTTEELIVMGIALNVVSGIGAALFARATDKIGPRRTIEITLVGLVLATIIGATAPSRTVFWGASILLGFMIGPNQAASRSFLAQLAPDDKQTEFFGFFAFSGRLASVLGPALYALVLGTTGSQRLAIASTLLFFISGWMLLRRVRERGARPLAA